MSVLPTDIASVPELEGYLVVQDVGLLVWLELMLALRFQLMFPMEAVVVVVS